MLYLSCFSQDVLDLLTRPTTPEGMGSIFLAPADQGVSSPAAPQGAGSRPATPEGMGSDFQAPPTSTFQAPPTSASQAPPTVRVRAPVGPSRPAASLLAQTVIQRAPSQIPARGAGTPVVSAPEVDLRQGVPPVRLPPLGRAVSVRAPTPGGYTSHVVLQTRIAQLGAQVRRQQEEYDELLARLPQGATPGGGPNQPAGVETALVENGEAAPGRNGNHDDVGSGDENASLVSNASGRSVNFPPDERIQQIIPADERVETEVSLVQRSIDSQGEEQSGPDPLRSDPVVAPVVGFQERDVLESNEQEQRRLPEIPNVRDLLTEASPSRVRALTLRDETVVLAESEMHLSEVVDGSLLGSRDVPVAEESPDSSYRAVGKSLLGSGIQSSTPVIPGTFLRSRMGADELGVTPVTVEKTRLGQSQRVTQPVSAAAARVGKRNSFERERLQAERRVADERVRLQAEDRNARVAARGLPKEDLPREVLRYSRVEASTDDSDNAGEGTPPLS